MAVTHTVTLNVDKDKLRLDQRVHVRTGDVSSQVVVCNMQYGGSAYTPASGSTAKLEILKPDGTWTVTSASISGSTVRGTIPAAAMTSPGECKRAYFRIINGSAEDTTEDFYLYVYPNATQDAIESSSYSDEFKALLEASSDELGAMLEEVEDARTGYGESSYNLFGDAIRDADSAAKAIARAISSEVSSFSRASQSPNQGTSRWFMDAPVEAGSMYVVDVTVNSFTPNPTVTNGRIFRLRTTLENATTADVVDYITGTDSGGGFLPELSVGKHTYYMVATGTAAYIEVWLSYASSPFDIEISLKKVEGFDGYMVEEGGLWDE